MARSAPPGPVDVEDERRPSRRGDALLKLVGRAHQHPLATVRRCDAVEPARCAERAADVLLVGPEIEDADARGASAPWTSPKKPSPHLVELRILRIVRGGRAVPWSRRGTRRGGRCQRHVAAGIDADLHERRRAGCGCSGSPSGTACSTRGRPMSDALEVGDVGDVVADRPAGASVIGEHRVLDRRARQSARRRP